MNRRLRVAVVSALLAGLAAVIWFYFAPIGLGGGTGYVITHGVSMEPLFHTGDLAIVRAASTYKIGEIVAYHSSLLHEVVLHRIVAIHDGRYTFKGDNNDFFDPVHPTRSQLIGRLWIHLPHVGLILEKLRTPVGAAALAVAIGLLLLGFEKQPAKGMRVGRVTSMRAKAPAVEPAGSEGRMTPGGLRDGLIAASVAALAFAALCLFAFNRPDRVAGTRTVPYTQQAAFSYSAHVQPDPVYPTGTIGTGSPIFLNFVHRLSVGLRYHLEAPGAAHLSGTSSVALELTGPSGWSRTMPLIKQRSFKNGQFKSTAVIDLGSIEALLSQVQRLTGVVGSDSTLAVVAKVHLDGLVSGSHLQTTFNPVLTFQLGATQLQPEGQSGTITTTPAGLNDTQNGSVTVASSAANPIRVFGLLVGVGLLRFLAVAGFLLSALAALALWIVLRRMGALAEPEKIEAQYRDLIVPLADDASFSGQEPVDVVSMDALARLAEHCGRLILHSQRDGADSYLLHDRDTLYRYRVGGASGKATGARRETFATDAGLSMDAGLFHMDPAIPVDAVIAGSPSGSRAGVESPAPESSAPGSAVPGSVRAPESSVPESSVPESPVPESPASESAAPESAAPSEPASAPAVPSIAEAAAAFAAAAFAAGSPPEPRAPARAQTVNGARPGGPEPSRLPGPPAAARQTPVRSRPAALSSPPRVSYSTISGGPADVPQGDASRNAKVASSDPHAADLGSLGGFATRVLFDAARRWGRRLT